MQIYLAPVDSGSQEGFERPDRWLAGFAAVEAGPGESVETEIPLPHRTFEIRHPEGRWVRVPGVYRVEAAHSVEDRRLAAEVTVGGE